MHYASSQTCKRIMRSNLEVTANEKSNSSKTCTGKWYGELNIV